MAQTLIARPYDFHPAFNQMQYIVDSTNKNNKAFNYIFEVYEAGTSNLLARYHPKPRFSDGYGVIDVAKLLQAKVSSEMQNANATNFFSASNCFYAYDMKVGESYIATINYTSALTNSSGYVRVNVTHSYVAGDQIFITQSDGGVANPQVEGYQTVTSVGVGYFVIGALWSGVSNANIDGAINYADNRRTVTSNILNYTSKLVFNGVLNIFEEIAYDGTKFNLTGATKEALTSISDSITVTDNCPLLVNFKTDSGAVRFENSDGDVLELTIVAGGTLTAVNVGTYNTPTLSVVSGTLPLIKPTTTYYDFYYYSSGQKSKKYRVNLLQGCTIEDKSILFLDKFGSILSIPVTLKSTLRTNVTRETYNKELIGSVSSQRWKPKQTEAGITQVNSYKDRSIVLNTPFLDKDMQELFFNMIESPIKMLFDSGDFYPITLDTLNSEFKMTQKAKLFMYEVVAKFSNNDAING